MPDICAKSIPTPFQRPKYGHHLHSILSLLSPDPFSISKAPQNPAPILARRNIFLVALHQEYWVWISFCCWNPSLSIASALLTPTSPNRGSFNMPLTPIPRKAFRNIVHISLDNLRSKSCPPPTSANFRLSPTTILISLLWIP